MFEHIDCKDLLGPGSRTQFGRKLERKGTLQGLIGARLACHVRSIRVEERDEEIIQKLMKQSKECCVKQWISQRPAHWETIVNDCCEEYSNIRALRLPPFIPTGYSHRCASESDVRTVMSKLIEEEIALPMLDHYCIAGQPIVIETYCTILSRLSPTMQHLTSLHLDMTFCQLKLIMEAKVPLAKYLTDIRRLRIEFPESPIIPTPRERTFVLRVKDKMTILIAQPELRSKPCNHQFIALALLVMNHAHYGNTIHHLEVASPDFTQTHHLDELARYDHSMWLFLVTFERLQTIELRVLEFHSNSIERTIRANKNTLREIAIKTCGLRSGAWKPILLAIKEVPNLLDCTLVGLNMTGPEYESQGSAITTKLRRYPELCGAMSCGYSGDYDALVELHSILKTRDSVSPHGVTARRSNPASLPYIDVQDGARPRIAYR